MFSFSRPFLGVMLCLAACLPAVVWAGSLTTLYSFGTNDNSGQNVNDVIQAGDGNFYGTTNSGGAYGCGTLSKITPAGVITQLHFFAGAAADGCNPNGLLQAGDGKLYGVTTSGGGSGCSGGYGCGTVYSISLDGSGYRVLYNFGLSTGDGTSPNQELIQGGDGSLYGTTSSGGASGLGTVFKLATDGSTYSRLYSFLGGSSDGSGPDGPLVQGSDGKLYGVAYLGGGSGCGGSGCGTVYRLATDGSGYAVLHLFAGGSSDGSNPAGRLVFGKDGRVYGVAVRGAGSCSNGFGCGAVYAMAPDGSGYIVLHAFTGTSGDATYPESILQATDGNLYGVANLGGAGSNCSGPPGGCGAAFTLATNGAGYAVLHSFSAGTANDGANPVRLIQANDGNFYGAASYGGGFYCGGFGCGTLFKFTPAGTTSVLVRFGTLIDGYNPVAPLVQGADGKLYGTTPQGGRSGCGTTAASSCGTAFGLATDGSAYNELFAFKGAFVDGSIPLAPLFAGKDGRLYGTTRSGGTDTSTGSRCGSVGCGTVFSTAPESSSDTVLYSFNGSTDDGQPRGGLIQAKDGNFYGTTDGFLGSVFKITPSGGYTLLSQFGSGGPTNPIGSLLQAADGKLYGVAQGGIGPGCGGICGGIYRLAIDGSGFAVLHAFGGGASDGGVPGSGLVQGADGSFYGTTMQGGAANQGTVYKLSADGSKLSVLHSFSGGSDGASPVGGLLLGSDNNLYGTTTAGGGSGCNGAGCGTVFGLDAQGGAYTVLYSFTAGADGAGPKAGLVQASDGNLYGTAQNGGPLGVGTVFRPVVPSPAAPTGLKASLGDGSVALSWTAVPGVANYGLYQGTTSGGESSVALRSSVAGTSATVSGLSDGSQYFFVVKATNISGTSGPSNEVSAIPLAAPAGLAVTAVGSGQLTLSWSAAAGANSYAVYQGTSAGAEASTAVLSGIAGTSATLTGLSNGTTYYFVVKGINSTGTGAASNEASGTPVAPPGGLAAAPGAGQVTLTWTAGAGATSYSIFEGTAAGGEASVPVQTGVSGTSAVVTGLTNGTAYFFVVKGVNASGSSAASNEAQAVPLAAPTGLTATAGNGQVALNWTAGAGAVSYNIYQGTAAGAESTTPVQTGISGTSATLTGLSNGATFYFVVRGVDSSGLSASSNEASATPQAPPAAPANLSATVGDGQVTLSWTVVAGATSYGVYQGLSQGGESAAPVQTVTGASANVVGLSNGSKYYFVVKAMNGGGSSAASNEVVAIPLATPTALVATAGNGQVNLSWNAAAGAASYNVYQGTAAGGESTSPVQMVASGTSTTISGLADSTTYFFIVKGANASGTSAASNEANATTQAPPGHGGGAFSTMGLLVLAGFAAGRKRRLTELNRRSGAK